MVDPGLQRRHARRPGAVKHSECSFDKSNHSPRTAARDHSAAVSYLMSFSAGSSLVRRKAAPSMEPPRSATCSWREGRPISARSARPAIVSRWAPSRWRSPWSVRQSSASASTCSEPFQLEIAVDARRPRRSGTSSTLASPTKRAPRRSLRTGAHRFRWLLDRHGETVEQAASSDLRRERPEHRATTPESPPVRSIPLGPGRAAATTPRATVRHFRLGDTTGNVADALMADIAGVLCANHQIRQ